MKTFADRADLVVSGFGWTVFPVDMQPPPGRKKPFNPGGRNAASNDPVQIDEWSRQWPCAAVGVPTGPENGIFVIDSDAEGATGILSRFGKLPATLTATSGRGHHLYFTHMGGRIVNRAGKMVLKSVNPYRADEWIETPGLDVRGDGGSIVVPPSVHHSGREYRFVDLDRRIALPPPWLLRMFGEKMEARKVRFDRSAPLPPSMDYVISRLRGAKEGSRNASLNEAAFLTGKAVRAGGVNEAEAVRQLMTEAIGLGLDRHEALATIKSGLGAGLKSR